MGALHSVALPPAWGAEAEGTYMGSRARTRTEVVAVLDFAGAVGRLMVREMPGLHQPVLLLLESPAHQTHLRRKIRKKGVSEQYVQNLQDRGAELI